MAFNIVSLFSVDKVVRRLEESTPIKTTYMDTVFIQRPQIESPWIPAELITAVVNELPYTRRGAPSIGATSETGSVTHYEPYPVHPNVTVTAADINNLRRLPLASHEAWAARRQEYLRRAVRKTTEALAAIALSGTLTWPIKLEGGGWENYTVAFGSVLSVTLGTLLTTSSKWKDVHDVLTEMKEALEEYGYGSTYVCHAGTDVYSVIKQVAESVTSTAKVTVEISDDAIMFGGFEVRRMAETYRNPQTGSAVKKLDAKKIRMVALDGEHMMPYAAVDDLDANLQPIPFHVKPVKMDDPSGWKLIAQSKPFPIPNIHAIVEATAVA